jgi:signal transduction histidine kinase
MYSVSEDNRFLEVTYANGDKEVLYFKDFAWPSSSGRPRPMTIWGASPRLGAPGRRIAAGKETRGVTDTAPPNGREDHGHTPAGVGPLIADAQAAFARELDRARRLEAIRAVTAEITRELDLGTVLTLIIQRATELVAADRGRIWLWDESERLLKTRASTQSETFINDVGVRLGESVVGTVAERAVGLIINDYRASALAHPQLVTRTRCAAIIAEPLLYRGRLLGVITAYNETLTHAFTEDHRAILTLFADQAAIAIANARLFEESARRGQRLSAILEGTKRLARGLDVPTTLTSIAEEAARLLGIDNAGFRLLEGDELVLAGVAGDAAATMPRARIKVGQSLSGQVVEKSRTISCDFASAANIFPDSLAAARALGYTHFLGVPLRVGERTIGALSFRARRPFTAPDQELAEAFAGQAAIAIEQSRLLAATEAQAVALKAKNAELDSFVYSVSHDLKSPLVSIEGLSSVLLSEYGTGLDADGRHLLERIQVNVQHLERLIGDLLALSRIGREARPPEDVDLGEVLDTVLEELRAPITTRGVEIVRGDMARVRAVRTQMEQVVRNLMSNAVKYLGDTAAPRVEIQTIEGEDGVECRVRDNGIGIDRAYHDKVFEMFQRLNEVEAPGTGVGLPIVKKIVDGAGGRIWIESARGEGTTVHFTWPRTDVQGDSHGMR